MFWDGKLMMKLDTAASSCSGVSEICGRARRSWGLAFQSLLESAKFVIATLKVERESTGWSYATG